MEFISGFAWPVPRAFAGAVSACRFEQGDVLYSDPAGYVVWSEAASRARTMIQVLDPPKSTRALGSDGVGGRFASNWVSPVELELTRPEADAPMKLTTSQGRLFRCLWRGHLAGLEVEDGEEPQPPAMQRELHRSLEQAVPAFRRRLSGRKRSGSLFLSVLDQAGDASRVKAHAIRRVLAETFDTADLELLPEDAGIEDASRFHPALCVQGIAVRSKSTLDEANEEAVEAMLKDLLYTPAEGKADRFSISRHGLLVPLRSA